MLFLLGLACIDLDGYGSSVEAARAEAYALGQKDAIEAFQKSLDEVEGKVGALVEENIAQEREIEAMTGALVEQAQSIQELSTVASPPGSIILWSGALAEIPPGWVLCDGTNNTPDLRGRFVKGAEEESSETTGGSSRVVLTTAELPPHDHGGLTGVESNAHTHAGTTDSNYAWNNCNAYEDDSSNAGEHPDTYGNYDLKGGNCGFQLQTLHSHTFSTGGVSQNHTHGIAVEGEGAPLEIEPPWIALFYIMRL